MLLCDLVATLLILAQIQHTITSINKIAFNQQKSKKKKKTTKEWRIKTKHILYSFHPDGKSIFKIIINRKWVVLFYTKNQTILHFFFFEI